MIPWGYDVAYPNDYNDMLALAKSAVSKFLKYKFSVGNSAALYYPAAGNIQKTVFISSLLTSNFSFDKNTNIFYRRFG